MRKEVIKYTKTVTKDTRLTEMAKVIKTVEELEYILRVSAKNHSKTRVRYNWFYGTF